MTLQDDHPKLDAAIWQALLGVLPEHWSSASLTVTTDSELEPGLAHSIENLDGERDIYMPSDEIYQLTMQHFDVFVGNGSPWRKAVWSVRFDFDIENWKCTTDIEY